MIHQTIVIVDFGGPYAQLVARRVRENNVYCEVAPWQNAMDAIRAEKPAGIIFTGGQGGVCAADAPDIDKAVYALGIPMLGIGGGALLMVTALGGQVEEGGQQAPGEVEISATGGLVRQAVETGPAWLAHPGRILQPPAGFAVTATGNACPYAAIEDTARRLYAVQFHPELEQTPFGREFLRLFLYNICGCTGDWTTANFVQAAVEDIRQTVGDGRVLCALSGGVDSTVCAVLVHKAIGERLNCVFVDHGLMRKNEGDQVMETLGTEFKLNVVRVNAGQRFLGRLAGVTEPEQKRKIIGHEFIEVFTDEAAKLGKMDFLLQGTIYPDIIESGVGDAALVKSHHNVGGLPEKLGFTLLEPLRYLFKDEVRKVGRQLGIPDFVVNRQPFPGPGLAVRCLGEVTEGKLFLLRESDAIVREEITSAGLAGEIWQYFAVLPNLRSVGVKGNERTYAHAVGIRAITSTDAMTSDWARIPHDVLGRISSRIVSEVPGVNRVLYDCTAKPPSTIEWE